MKKRIISMCLAVCVVLALLPAEVPAAEQADAAGGDADAFDVGTGAATYADSDTITYVISKDLSITVSTSGVLTKCSYFLVDEIDIPAQIPVEAGNPDAEKITITSIGEQAFSYCMGLERITIPDSVTRIEDQAFYHCSGLARITIPASVTSIGDSAFTYCGSLTSIDIPGNVTSIGDETFCYCGGLTSIRLPSSVTSIGDRAFSECVSLTSINIPDAVTSIGNGAFGNCRSLTDITIPNGVISIGDYAFSGCSGLTSITIPASVKEIGGNVFGGTSNLRNIRVDASNPNYCSIDNILFSKDKTALISYPVWATGDYTIPDSVTSIGSHAFHGCGGLTGITIPNAITSIGNYVFYDCSGLTSITIPDGVTSIGDYAFSGCSGLTSITIPDGVTSIGEDAFNGCSGLTSIDIPDGVTSIGNYVFCGCSGLTGITIPDGVTDIGYYAFCGCSGLTGITIPDGVTSIGSFAFDCCSGLTDITIPDGVTIIGHFVFSGCSGLTSITIPDGVTIIGDGSFEGCSGLTGILIPDSVTSIGNDVFRDCNPDFIIYCYPGSAAESYARDNNINYEPIGLSARVLSVSVSGEDGTVVNNGFSVTWYDEEGNKIGTSNTLVGADKEKSYSFEILLDNSLSALYEQPERGTIAPSDPTTRAVRLVKKAEVKKLTLSGQVKDQSGAPVQGAAVTITPAGGDSVKTVTGADGGFSVPVPYGIITVTIQKDGCYSKNDTLDLTGITGSAHNAGTYTLSPVRTDTDCLTLKITQRRAAENVNAAAETPLASLGALRVELTGANGPITDFEVQGLTLLFKSGVSANESVKVTVTDPSGAYCAASATAVLDSSRLGSAELTMVQKGSFVLGGVSGPNANIMVFDSAGNCVQSGAAASGLNGRPMEPGTYQAVLIQKSDLLRGISNLRYLGTFGLQEGRDYLLRQITIADGRITRLADCAVPALDESRISYTIAENTSVTASKPNGIAVGELLMIRAAYELDPAKGVSADSLRIALPDGVSLVESSVLIDYQTSPYTYDSDKREVSIPVSGRQKAAVWLYCTPTKSGSHSIGAFLTLSNGAAQPIGAAAVQAEDARLRVPKRTGRATGLVAYGKTRPGCAVTLYDNGVKAGQTSANPSGSWVVSFDLTPPVYSPSDHNIYAVIEGGNLTDSISTETVLVTYDERLDVELKQITMYNTGDHGEQETVLDFTSQSTAAPYYRIWPSRYPTFTFKAEFTDGVYKPEEVYVVTTNSAGEQTYVETAYDAASGAWVGTHDYTSSYDAPVAVTAEYGYGDTLARPVVPIIDPSGYVYEAVPSNRLYGVTAVISQQNGDSQWNASAYDQVNPQITGADGSYYWDVPRGSWKVRFTKEGYAPADTSQVEAAVNGWLPVPPPQLDINVGMVSDASPFVENAVAYTNQIQLVFSQYMDIASVQSAVSLTRDGTDAGGLTVRALNAEFDGTGTNQYATRFAVVPNDGGLSGKLVVSVSGGAKNYAGKTLTRAYTSQTMTAGVQPTEISGPDSVSVALHGTAEAEVVLQPGVGGQTLTVESLSPALVGIGTTKVTTGADGRATVRLTGELPGSGQIRITEPISGLSKDITVLIAIEAAAPAVPGSSASQNSSSGSETVRKITISNVSGGKVTVSPEYASPGGTVTVTAIPDTGYELASLTVTDINNKALTLTNLGNGKYTFIMPNSKVKVEAAFRPSAEAETIESNPFIDVDETAWYYDAVMWSRNQGISKGEGGRKFNPDTICTRAEMLTFLWRANGSPEPAGEGKRFTDVAPGSYYEKAVQWAADSQIVKGEGKRKFNPTASVTRAETITFLYRANGSSAGGDNTRFVDVISDAYYASAVQWAVNNKIAKGMGSRKFNPDMPCTRAQVVTFLYRDSEK